MIVTIKLCEERMSNHQVAQLESYNLVQELQSL